MSKNCEVCSKGESRKCTGCGNVFYCSREHQKVDWQRHKSQCLLPWTVATDETGGRGRFIVATKDISAGEVLFSEAPTLVAPRTIDAPPVCIGCHYPIPVQHFSCPDCNVPLCEPDCRSSQLHQSECHLLSKRLDREKEFSDYDVIAAFRFLNFKKNHPDTYKNLKSLCSNIEEKKKSFGWNSVEKMTQKLVGNFNVTELFDVEEIEVQKAICSIDSNSFQLLTKSTKEPLTGVFLKASMFNHNCYPNARPILYEDQTLRFVASKNIKSGSEISISYIDSLHTTIQRRAILKTTKNFSCNCQRCQDPTEFGTYSSSLFCSSCKANGTQGWVTSTDPLQDAASWQCSTCLLYLDSQTVITLEKQLLSELFRVKRDSYSNLKKFYHAYQNHLHPNHVFITQLKLWMIKISSNLLNTLNEEEIQEILRFGCDVIENLKKLEPSQTFIIGLTCLEVSDVIFQYLRRFGCTDTNFSSMILSKASEFIASSVEVLRHEDKNTLEGALYEKALEIEQNLTRQIFGQI